MTQEELVAELRTINLTVIPDPPKGGGKPKRLLHAQLRYAIGYVPDWVWTATTDVIDRYLRSLPPRPGELQSWGAIPVDYSTKRYDQKLWTVKSQ